LFHGYNRELPKKTAKELIHDIKRDDPRSGWAGDSVEREWAETMLYFSNESLQDLEKRALKLSMRLAVDLRQLATPCREKRAGCADAV
jgi:hypothetical protein